MQPQEKQLAHEKEMLQLKLQQEKDPQQDENVVELQNEKHQHEDEKLQNEDQQEDDDVSPVFTFFYLNYRILILPRNFRA